MTSTAEHATVRVRRARKAFRARERAGELLLLLPLLTIMAVAVAAPTISVIYHAFTAWEPGYPSPWVGFENFKDLFALPQFQQILRNHAFLLLGLPLWIIGPLAVAFMLYEGVPYPGLFRAIFFFPATAAPALVGVLFVAMLGPEGPINTGLHGVGLGALAGNWLSDPSLVKPVLIVVLAWATLGFGVVIFSAGLSGVAPELFEAAEVDGASWWQRMRYVALPSLRQLIELWTVILVVSVFVGIFPWIFTLTRGGPGDASSTMDYDIYKQALQFGFFGTAAAEAVSLLLIVLIIVGAGALLARRAGRAR